MTRITSLADLPERGGAEYAQGLRAAVGAGVEYGIEGLERSEQQPPFVPDALLAQARLAARSGVGLDTVLRRYVAGHALLGDFLVQEAEGHIAPGELKQLLRRLALALDVLLAAVTASYGMEQRRHRRTAEQRRTELVERLLAGEPLDASELGYEMEGWHLGLVVRGSGMGHALTLLARDLDARLLVVAREEEIGWAWIGGRVAFNPADVCRAAAAIWPQRAVLAVGEPGEGPAGWRLSHHQARAALPVAWRGPEPLVRYADVAMLAATLQDQVLATSLRQLYLDPLKAERDGGAALIETLSAYFEAEQNVSSAASILGVDRRTVSNRLRTTEALVGSALEMCMSDLQMALRLDELER